MDNWDKPFWRSVFSESDGTGSSVRLCVFLVISFALMWVSFIVVRKTALPDFAGITMFVGGVCTALYAINQYVSIKKQGGGTDANG